MKLMLIYISNCSEKFNIQFIVTTHSPYILTSISNAVIYDLEKKVQFNDMSNYSIGDISEGYFDTLDYSIKLQEDFDKYKGLLNKNDITEQERKERATLHMKFKNISGELAPRIKSEFDEIEKERNNGQN